MVTSTNYGEVTVLTVKGELTADTLDELVEQRDQLIATARANLVLDAGAVTAFDSAGLEALVVTGRTCAHLKGTLKIASLDETARKIFEITRLDRKFELYGDLDSAVRSFG